MRPRLINLEATAEALRPFLKEYLEEQGIDTSKNFICINPKHNEKKPSMTCAQHEERAYCFSCSTAADIFAAATFLEGKPDKGPGWVEENLLYLAKKFGVQVDLEDLTPEEIYEYRTYRAYSLAAQLISDSEFGDYQKVDKEIAFRGWDKAKLTGWGIGTVNYDEYKARMKASGFEPGFLSGIDLDRSNLFNNNNLLFTVYDDAGRPVGFSAKNLKHTGDKSSGPKYINTRGTGLECAIFKKGERLYGVDIAKEAHSPLYIFEGQADVITARHMGLMNCCCTMGTALTDHHITLLKKHGLFNVVLVFDADEAGQLAVKKALDEKFAKEKDFRVKLCQLTVGQDPDELFREKGIDEFIRLKKYSAFEWRMKNFVEEIEGELTEDKRIEIAEKMIPIIVTEPSHLKHEEMAKQVAKITGFDKSTILSETKRLRNEKEAEIQTKKRNVIQALMKEVEYHPEDAELALSQCQTAIADINKSVQGEGEASSSLNTILSLKEVDEAKSGDFAGFFMEPGGLGSLAARLDDDWKSDTLMFIGGGEQAGKTTLATQMAFEIARNSKNNAICIYHSIDDAAKFIIYKWICQAGYRLDKQNQLTLNHAGNPNYWATQEGFEYVKLLREQAYKEIIRLIKDQKLVIKDASDGSSLNYAKTLVTYYREAYPDKKIILFTDNFHKLPDHSHLKGHERTRTIANDCKNLTVSHHLTQICTAEYRKLQAGEKPSNMALAESRGLAYDASIIWHLYNDLHHSSEEEAELIHMDEEGNVYPRILCKFGKNKISGYEGQEFLDLWPGRATMCGVDKDTAKAEYRARKEFLIENSKNS